MYAKRLIFAGFGLFLLLVTYGFGTTRLYGQAGPQLVGVTEICMTTQGLVPFTVILAIDDAGRLYVHSDSPNAPPEMSSGWLLYGELPAGTPKSISVRDALPPHGSHRVYVTMENGDMYAAPGGNCITFGNRLEFQFLGNVFGGVPVQTKGHGWGEVKGSYRK